MSGDTAITVLTVLALFTLATFFGAIFIHWQTLKRKQRRIDRALAELKKESEAKYSD